MPILKLLQSSPLRLQYHEAEELGHVNLGHWREQVSKFGSRALSKTHPTDNLFWKDSIREQKN